MCCSSGTERYNRTNQRTGTMYMMTRLVLVSQPAHNLHNTRLETIHFQHIQSTKLCSRDTRPGSARIELHNFIDRVDGLQSNKMLCIFGCGQHYKLVSPIAIEYELCHDRNTDIVSLRGCLWKDELPWPTVPRRSLGGVDYQEKIGDYDDIET